MVSTAEAPVHPPAARCSALNRGDHILLQWPDGRRDVLHATWLRDNCGCERCRHPGNGQRLLDVTELPRAPRIASATLDADGALHLRFTPEDHHAVFSRAWLREYGVPGGTRVVRALWGRDRAPDVARTGLERVSTDTGALRDWLASLAGQGFALLGGVPCEPGTVERVAALFGYVRETNYGRHFDVRSSAEPINLAYTRRGLSVHTDNPYRDPAPTLQLLHCLRNDASGGETLLVDGFAAAERLRAESPFDFELLTRWRVPFRFESSDTLLQARVLLIETDDRGDVQAVRYNSRSVAPFDTPPDVLPAFCRAYRTFARLLMDDSACIRLRLAPGDLLALDNRRVLHGRTAFEADGERWLQGCYADADSLQSRLAVLTLARQGKEEPA